LICTYLSCKKGEIQVRRSKEIDLPLNGFWRLQASVLAGLGGGGGAGAGGTRTGGSRHCFSH